MDSLVTMIVDILRRGKENRALNQGGQTAGTRTPVMPRPIEPRHDGVPYDEIVTQMERGR
jgi:hypothetical protein